MPRGPPGGGPLGGYQSHWRPKALSAGALGLRARVGHDVAEVLEEVRGAAARVGVVQRGQGAVLAVLTEVADLTGDVVAELPDAATAALHGVGEERVEGGRPAVVGLRYQRAAVAGDRVTGT